MAGGRDSFGKFETVVPKLEWSGSLAAHSPALRNRWFGRPGQLRNPRQCSKTPGKLCEAGEKQEKSCKDCKVARSLLAEF